MPELIIEQPPDLYQQVLALGHVYTRKLPPEWQEDFRQAMALDIFAHWHEYDPTRGRLSTWVMTRARIICTTFMRQVKYSMRHTHVDFNRPTDDDIQSRAICNENWLLQVASPAFRGYDQPEDDDFDIESSLDTVQDIMPLTDTERAVIEIRCDGADTRDISETLPPSEDQLHDARKLRNGARKKLEAANVFTESKRVPREPIDNMLRLHGKRQIPFPTNTFHVISRSQGLKCLSGIDGVQETVALVRAMKLYRERVFVEIPLPAASRSIAKEFWHKYGNVVRSCSAVCVDNPAEPQKLLGALPTQETASDVLMGLTVFGGVSKINRVRHSAPFEATPTHFALMIDNFKAYGLLQGPAFNSAVESWRHRIEHGTRKSRCPRIPQQTAQG